MAQSKSHSQSIGVCSAVIGSSALATRAKRTLEQYKIQATVSKATSQDGCVYIVNFPCVQRMSAEDILKSHGIKIKGYL